MATLSLWLPSGDRRLRDMSRTRFGLSPSSWRWREGARRNKTYKPALDRGDNVLFSFRTPEGIQCFVKLRSRRHLKADATLSGLVSVGTFVTQGSSFLATLG